MRNAAFGGRHSIFALLALLGLTGCGSSSDGGSQGGTLPGTWEKGYEPHATVPGDTTAETSAPTAVQSGQATKVSLTDGTALTFPVLTATSGSGPLTTVTLGRESSDVDLASLDHAATGSMRVLTFDAFDPVARGLIAANVAPVLTIPAKEVGAIDRDTVNVARVADMMDSGKMTRTVEFLPVTWDAAGNLMVRDYLFPDSVATDLELTDTGGGVTTQTRTTLPAGYVPRPRRITYVVGTFQGSANWSLSPKLVRMVPVADAPEKRKPLDRLDASTRADVEKRCFSTAVILVHGHNEEESLGYAGSTTDEPWRASYKRDVWTHLYGTSSYTAPNNCARFYEFVYPTYRAAFTPQNGRERLDEAFAREVLAELRPQLDAKVPISVVIVAHSMGGLVARAGVQLFDPNLQKSLSDVITWGSPHTGSPLVTLHYVFTAVPGYDARHGLVSVGLDNVDHTLYALRRAIENVQVDSPGSRDLRWARSATTTPHDLALDQLFELSVDQQEKDQFFDLVNGPWLYNTNLTQLNGADIYRNADKYYAMYGVTTKRANVTWKFGKWFRPTIDVGSDIAIGATALAWLMKDPDTLYSGQKQSASDGAVPMTSMAGAGVVALGRTSYQGDTDHEEYFGAPSAPGTFTKDSMADDMANATWSKHSFTCPSMYTSLYDDIFSTPEKWDLTGDFGWPGVDNPASLVTLGAGVLVKSLPDGPEAAFKDFAVSANGSYTAWAPQDALPWSAANNDMQATLTLVDGTFARATGYTGACVTAETPVTMSDGTPRAIADVQVGDEIATVDPVAPGAASHGTVERVLRHRGAYVLQRVVADGGLELDVTGNHPVLTAEGGYQPAETLLAGDRIMVLDPATERAEARPILAIIRDASRRSVVYNLKTSRGQYVASGIVVHNKCLSAGSLVDTPSGPRAVEELAPGDLVLTLAPDGARAPTRVTHAYVKTTVLTALPGRWLTPDVRVTDNHVLVGVDGSVRSAAEAGLPRTDIRGAVYDLATEAGTYLVGGVLVAGGD